MSSNKRPVIFCDFDGTITENDNIIALVKHFDPPGWKEIVDDILERRISIRTGVGRLFALLPSSRREEVIRYAIDNARIRSGFADLLTYCREQNIEFYVTSGGIDFFVYPLLAPFGIPEAHIYCNGSSFDDPTITITWPHPCDDHCHTDCGMCKTTIMRRFPTGQYRRILIGDSITDFEGAKLADLVFARSHLAERCREIHMDYVPYETFHEVVDGLRAALAPRA